MILCTMPECQTSAGCLCQRRGIISDPATVPSRDYVNMLKDEIEMLKEKVRLHCADAKTAWAECDLLRSELANARNAAMEEAAALIDRTPICELQRTNEDRPERIFEIAAAQSIHDAQLVRSLKAEGESR